MRAIGVRNSSFKLAGKFSRKALAASLGTRDDATPCAANRAWLRIKISKNDLHFKQGWVNTNRRVTANKKAGPLSMYFAGAKSEKGLLLPKGFAK